jgi:anthranilate synthase/aminodeoxychorismate synthase-like glutamine amidotransferase
MSDASLLREKGYSHNVVQEFDRRNLVRSFVLRGGKPTLLLIAEENLGTSEPFLDLPVLESLLGSASVKYEPDGIVDGLSLASQGSVEQVILNDRISVQEVKERIQKHVYDAVVISPGPDCPTDAGITLDLIRELGTSRETEGDAWAGTPILGVCLGHQAIGEVFGGQVVRAPEPVHGKPAHVYHQGKGIFAGLPSPFEATRYHSLIVDRETLPKDLEVLAWTEDHLIMGLRHRKYP